MRRENSTPSRIADLVPLIEMGNRIGYVYGSEDVSMLFYSLIRRERPRNVVEFGTGLGVTAMWMAQALKESGGGCVSTFDDGSHWADAAKFRDAIRPILQVDPFGPLAEPTLDYATYMDRLPALLGLEAHVRFRLMHLDPKAEEAATPAELPFLAEPVDFAFLDVSRTPGDILDCLCLLLPHIATSASIFIDSASTSLTSFLFLERLVEQLNRSKVPRRFLAVRSEERRRALLDIVAQKRFTLMHLVERVQREQNSTAWLRIEPIDYVPHPQALMKWV